MQPSKRARVPHCPTPTKWATRGIWGLEDSTVRKGEGNRGGMIRMRATDAVEGSARTEICSCTESVLYVPIAGNVHVACGSFR